VARARLSLTAQGGCCSFGVVQRLCHRPHRAAARCDVGACRPDKDRSTGGIEGAPAASIAEVSHRQQLPPKFSVLVGPIVDECTSHARFIDEGETAREEHWQLCPSTVGEHTVAKPKWTRRMIR